MGAAGVSLCLAAGVATASDGETGPADSFRSYAGGAAESAVTARGVSSGGTARRFSRAGLATEPCQSYQKPLSAFHVPQTWSVSLPIVVDRRAAGLSSPVTETTVGGRARGRGRTQHFAVLV